jgi:hypothetical protein
LHCATQPGKSIDYVETDSISARGSLNFEDGNIAGGGCSVNVAALALGIIGTVLAASSLTWNIASFLLQGARPRLTPVVGVLTPDAGHLLSPATENMSDTLRQTIEQFDGPLVVGLQVTNVGRAPFHVAGWGIRPESAKHTFVPTCNELGMPPKTACDIAPGAHALFLTELVNAFAVIAHHKANESLSLCLRMMLFSGGHDRKSKAVPLALLKSMQNTRTKTIVTNSQSPEADKSHQCSDREQRSLDQPKARSTHAPNPTRLSW